MKSKIIITIIGHGLSEVNNFRSRVMIALVNWIVVVDSVSQMISTIKITEFTSSILDTCSVIDQT